MKVDIKLLDPEKDREYLREAWHFSDSAPQWFKDASSAWKETFEEFAAGVENEMVYGVFTDDALTAAVRLIPDEKMFFDIHLYAKRKTPFDVLLQAGESVKQYLFDRGVKCFYGWICEKNRGVIRLYRELGFVHNGATEIKGEYRGRPILWLNMICPNPKFIDLEKQ